MGRSLQYAERAAWILGVLLFSFAALTPWAAERTTAERIAALDSAASMAAVGVAPEARLVTTQDGAAARLPKRPPPSVAGRVSPRPATLAGAAPAGPAADGLRHALDRADTADWAPGRIARFTAALTGTAPEQPEAVLRIRRLGLEAAVFPGTSEYALNLGLGHVEGTAAPGSDGNYAVAGHRDGFFRRLRHVVPGDAIEVRGPAGAFVYLVESTRIVEPTDVHVLDDGDEPSITLVTCYPFHFLGNAPQRFIVRGVLAGTASHPRPEQGELP